MPTETANWLANGFLAEPLRDWDISRPAPYFGFEIPDAPGHYFYVWLDAPVGYMSSTLGLVPAATARFEHWWGNPGLRDPPLHRQGHRLLHTLFWPAMLRALEAPLPTRVHVHGFPDRERREDEQAQGNVRLARTYLDHLSPDLPPLLLRDQALGRSLRHGS
jgi:methionyl-tRNA synthetase